uniref:Epoxyqueuosine reductase QueH n=1 Tax=candidate division WOR-3 bacterium TaxID=2052148 RepID=A0A7V3PTK5_UNCW3
MPGLLLHICCGPCASVVIPRLQEQYQVTGFFYNPNIFPFAEYERRLEAAARVADFWKIGLIKGEYEHTFFQSAVQGLENEPEGGTRCTVCFRLRLAATAAQAVQAGFTLIASTLTVGPNKKAEVVNRIGHEAVANHGINFISGDWKKQDGFKQSVTFSRRLGLYRQNYCGCEFSIKNFNGAHR